MGFEIIGSSADYMPKRKLRYRLRDVLSIVWFVRTSFRFMRGSQSAWKTALQMIPAYLRYAKICMEQ
jgi:hypothetical protein